LSRHPSAAHALEGAFVLSAALVSAQLHARTPVPNGTGPEARLRSALAAFENALDRVLPAGHDDARAAVRSQPIA